MAKKGQGSSTPNKKKTNGKKAKGLNSTAFLKEDVSKLSALQLKRRYELAETARLHYEAQMVKSEAVGFTKPSKSTGISSAVIQDVEMWQALHAQLKPFAEFRDKVEARLKKLGWNRVYRANGYEWFNTKK